MFSNILAAVMPLLNSLGKVLKNLFLGIFLFRAGENKQNLEGYKEETKDAKKANEIRNSVSGLTDDELRNSLRHNKSTKK